MAEHRLERIDFRRPARFTAVCACGWRSDAMLNAGLAGSLWDRHREDVPDDAPTAQDTSIPTADACRELAEDLVPTIKEAVRSDTPLTAVDAIERMELLAGTLGDREQRLARAVRREWARLAEDATSRQRATVVVGLVELGERAREHLSRVPSVDSRN